MEQVKEVKKNNLAFKILGRILMYFFPIVKVLSINAKLRRINRIKKNDWVLKQKLFNYLWAMICSAPIVLTLFLSYVIYLKQPLLATHINQAVELFLSLKMSAFIDKVNFINSNNQTVGPLSAITGLLFYGFLTSFVLGAIYLHKNPLITETKKLYDLLVRNGFIDKDDKNRLVLATPEYFLIDVSGLNPREIKDADRIWRTLNVRVENFYEDKDQRSIVVFQISFELEKSYKYEIK